MSDIRLNGPLTLPVAQIETSVVDWAQSIN